VGGGGRLAAYVGTTVRLLGISEIIAFPAHRTGRAIARIAALF
jgi:hypothetical protein